MRFRNLTRQDLREWLHLVETEEKPIQRLIFVASGYESRSQFWASAVRPVLGGRVNIEYRVLAFTERKTDGARPQNDDFFRANGFEFMQFGSEEERSLSYSISNLVKEKQKENCERGIEIHIDYSSMPRRWYCALFNATHACLRPDDSLYMWYAGGVYNGEELPTAGMSDFSVFSGSPTITPRVRTHVFGLGFDRIRASAIFRVLDPQNLVCFYGEPGVRHDYVERVRKDNRDLLAAARFEFSVPINDFPEAFSRIADIIRDYSRFGDVVLVPDGPKPLVLASSLIPQFFDKRGIVSLHVRRRKDESSPGLDVKASGSVYGFSVSGPSYLHT